MSKYIDLIALNRVLTNLRTELEKGTNTKYGITATAEASNKLAPGANLVVTNAEGTQTKKLFDGTKDITITATEMGVNTKAEDITLLDKKVSKVTGKKLSTEDYSTVDKNKLIGIEANANNYTHPETHPASMVVETASKRFVTDADKTNWSNKYTKVETDNVLETALGSIIWKAAVATFEDIATTYPEPQDGWVVNVNDTDITYRYTGTAWIAISANAIPVATTTVDGKMSKEDKTKIDGIEVGANLYVHPENHPASMITQKSTHRFVTDAEKTTYSDKDTKSEFDTKALAKVDIANVATVEEVDALFSGLFPTKPVGPSGPGLKLSVKKGFMASRLSDFLTSWGDVYLGNDISTTGTIPGAFVGDVLIKDAVALEDYENGGFSTALGNRLLEVSGELDTSKCINMAAMFDSCANMTKADLSKWDVSAVTTMAMMFGFCSKLVELNLAGWNTSKVTDFSLFITYTESLTSVDLSHLDFSSTTTMFQMFNGAAVTEISLPNLVSNTIVNMGELCNNARGLVKFSAPNYQPNDTLTNLSKMFKDCVSLTTVELNKFNADTFPSYLDFFGGVKNTVKLYMNNPIVQKGTVDKVAKSASDSNTPLELYVSDASKHDGLSYAGVTFIVG